MDEIISIVLAEPAPVVFVALMKSLRDLGYTVKSLNKTEGLLDFRTGVSLGSWRGQDMTAKLIGTSETTTELKIISAAMGEGCAILHGFDWAVAKRTSRKIIGKTLRYLVSGSISPFEIIQPLWCCPECGCVNAFWLSACVKCGRKD